MSIHGVYLDKVARDPELVKTLHQDDMERCCVVPKTVMINQWADNMHWLIIDRSYPAQIERRHQLLVARGDMVIDRLPGEDVRAAERELRDSVVDYLVHSYPQYFQRHQDLVLSPLTGLVLDVGPQGADPLVAVALLATEDMLLLLPETRNGEGKTTYVLKAGALLFPNGWSLRSHFNQARPDDTDTAAVEAWRRARQKSEKAARLGKSPSEIHDGHVSHYMQHFALRVDLFFSKMEPGMRTWRRNWGMRLTDELFLHSDAMPSDLPSFSPENWESYGYLRSEHETFTKLAQCGAVVFTIKTYLWKLSELVKNPAALQALILANENLAPLMFEYRADSLPTFRSYLARQPSASSAS